MRIALGDFVTSRLTQGWVSWIFLVWTLQVIVSTVDVLLKLMFSQRYGQCVIVGEPKVGDLTWRG